MKMRRCGEPHKGYCPKENKEENLLFGMEKKPVIIYYYTIMMSGPNEEHFCEFLIFGNEHELPGKWIKCIPHYKMHEMYIHDLSNQAVVFPGQQMTDVRFLGYLATLARNPADRKHNIHWKMESWNGPKSTCLYLRPGMSASTIADLTGFELEKVRTFYSDYFVVE